ncbi:MAG: putative 2-dehydropantoate 2-reductase [Desulfuromonadales bacterium]|nr:putative 2-dehydropantoate 2-reductase [Desulfuromonadales bacterium]
MRTAIIGAGALGLYYGALLQRGGEEVHFLLRRDYDAIMSDGLRVFSIDGDFHLQRVNGHRETDNIGTVDLVVVGLKTFDNNKVYSLIAPLIGPETAVLTLQNGLGNEEYLARSIPAEQILGGVAFLCANRGVPGIVHHLGQGRVRIGAFRPEATDRCRDVAKLFSAAGLNCESVDDLLKTRWEKLVWNIPFNGLCALTGLDVTALLSDPHIRDEISALMTEVATAANAQKISSPIETARFIEQMLTVTESMSHYRPSMMIDRMEGRPLELESIYVEPLRRAQAAGVATPRIELLHALLALGE